MAHVQTVLGAIDPAALGFTLPHEHTQITLWQIPARWDYWQLTRDACESLIGGGSPSFVGSASTASCTDGSNDAPSDSIGVTPCFFNVVRNFCSTQRMPSASFDSC